MAISEKKMQIVIDNHFKDECDVNTSIRQAFEKGFRIGVKKGQRTELKTGKWVDDGDTLICNRCGAAYNSPIFHNGWNYCPNCGAKMEDEK